MDEKGFAFREQDDGIINDEEQDGKQVSLEPCAPDLGRRMRQARYVRLS